MREAAICIITLSCNYLITQECDCSNFCVCVSTINIFETYSILGFWQQTKLIVLPCFNICEITNFVKNGKILCC